MLTSRIILRVGLNFQRRVDIIASSCLTAKLSQTEKEKISRISYKVAAKSKCDPASLRDLVRALGLQRFRVRDRVRVTICAGFIRFRILGVVMALSTKTLSHFLVCRFYLL